MTRSPELPSRGDARPGSPRTLDRPAATRAAAAPSLRPHFVVGTGRCGSTLLSTIFRSHPDVLSISELFTALVPDGFPPGKTTAAELWRILSEPRPSGRILVANRLEPDEFLYPVDAGGRFTRQTGVPPIAMTCLPHLTDEPDVLYAELERFVAALTPAPVGVQYARVFDELAARLGKRMWIERSGGSLAFAESLVRSFPGARFVHIHRDGRACALSMSRAPAFRLDLVRRLLEAELGYDPYASAERPTATRLPEELRPLLPETFDPEAFWALPIPVARFGRQWSTMVLRGLRALAAVPPEDVLHVSYERLTAEPEAELERLFAFLELAPPDGVWLAEAAARVEQRPSKRSALPANELRELERATRAGEEQLRRLRRTSTPAGAPPARGRRRPSLPPGPRRLSRPERRWLREPERLLDECRARYGPLFTLRMEGMRPHRTPVVVVGEREAVKELFRRGPELTQVHDSRERVRRFVGDDSVFLLDGGDHIRRRRLTLPHFHGAALRRSEETILDVVDRHIDEWPTGEPFSLASSMFRVTFEILVRATFGIDDLEWQRELRRLAHAVLRPWSGPGLVEDAQRARAELSGALRAEIARRRQEGGDRTSILALFVDSVDDRGERLDDKQIHDELMTLLMAAHETAAVGLAWTFEHALRREDVVERLREEADSGGSRYADAVVDEGLRIRPPVPIVTRTLVRPWSVGRFELPAASVVAPCIYLVNRDPEIYSEPESFRPERFLERTPDTYSWLPFGGGVRRCIGASFAEFEMRLVVQRIVARTRLELVDPGPPAGRWRMIVLAPGATRAVVRERRA